MNDYLSRAGKTLLIIIVVVLSVAYVSNLREPIVKLVPVQDPNYVQNIGEAQRRLKEQGLYHGEIDYIWGPLMEEAYCNYCAIREVEGE